MTESQRIELLENIPGFQKIPFDPLRALVSYMEFVGYEHGKTLYREGDPSDYFGFILSGEVELGKGMDPAADRVTFLVKSRRGIGFSFFDDLTLVHKDNPISYLSGKSDLMSYYQHGHPFFS